MKKILFFTLLCLMALTANAQWVDLGLPSGTLWKDKNEVEGFYTYEQAASKFANSLPTKEQMEELKTKCKWKWTGNGYKVVGPNGNSIVLPAEGSRNCDGYVIRVGTVGFYWSSTPKGSDVAWSFYFGSGGVYVEKFYLCSGQSVRLVQNVEAKYVDLGLPSGTLWKDKNESGLYDSTAVEIFGDKLPDMFQLFELKDKCSWTWTGSGYKVVGPNGKSIYLPAAGYHTCDGLVKRVGSCGDYWSSNLRTFLLRFDSVHVYMDLFRSQCDRGSIRLVQEAEVEAKYVDLGLPSGTLWKNKNEEELYTYDQAVSKFGRALPTSEQLEELKNLCQWTWTGNGYCVVGPNGNFIRLPAAGYRTCGGFDRYGGSSGYYWSSTPNGLNRGYTLGFDKGRVGMYGYDRCYGMPVRLVQNK